MPSRNPVSAYQLFFSWSLKALRFFLQPGTEWGMVSQHHAGCSLIFIRGRGCNSLHSLGPQPPSKVWVVEPPSQDMVGAFQVMWTKNPCWPETALLLLAYPRVCFGPGAHPNPGRTRSVCLVVLEVWMRCGNGKDPMRWRFGLQRIPKPRPKQLWCRSSSVPKVRCCSKTRAKPCSQQAVLTPPTDGFFPPTAKEVSTCRFVRCIAH